jgi:hypothetical protein
MKRANNDEIQNGPSDPDHLLQFRNTRQNTGGRGKKNEDSFENGAVSGSAWALFSRQDVEGVDLGAGLVAFFVCLFVCVFVCLFKARSMRSSPFSSR